MFEIINIAYPNLQLSVYEKYSEYDKFSLFIHVEDEIKTTRLYTKAYGKDDPVLEEVEV